MSIQRRNNVTVRGDGDISMIFAHGYGCDQNMWRLLAPAYHHRYRTVLYDLCGSGRSDWKSYDRKRHATLHGHASDLLEIAAEFARGPSIFVGHSVSSMIGMLAAIAEPERFSALVMIGPSPCYINDGDYVGGFTRGDIDALLDTLDRNYLGWASAMAPTIMGVPERPELARELTNSFCQADPEIAKHFARVTFLGDNRADLPMVRTPTLILQCTEDIIAPCAVGEYTQRAITNSTLKYIENVGHCPHLSEPSAIAEAMNDFLGR